MFSCRLRQGKLGSFGAKLCTRACGDQAGGGARVAEPKAVPCRVTGRHGGDPYLFFWALSRADAAVEVGCSLPREAYGVRGCRAANASVGTVTRRQISLHARPACSRRTEKRFFNARTIRRNAKHRDARRPWRSASKKALGRLRDTSAASGKRKKPLFRAT